MSSFTGYGKVIPEFGSSDPMRTLILLFCGYYSRLGSPEADLGLGLGSRTAATSRPLPWMFQQS